MNEAPPAGAPMRASDQDRDLAVSDLRDACTAGRLTYDEYVTRMQSALAAPTVQELFDLTADIPRNSSWVGTAPVLAPPSFGESVRAWGVPPHCGSVPYPSMPALRPHTRMNPFAVIGFVLSFVGLVTCPLLVGSLLAGLFGIVGLRQIQRSYPREDGQALAVAAIAIAASSVVLGLEVLLHGFS